MGSGARVMHIVTFVKVLIHCYSDEQFIEIRRHRALSSWYQRCHYFIHRRTFRGIELPTSLNEIPGVFSHSGIFWPFRTYTPCDELHDLKAALPMKRHGIKEYLYRRSLDMLNKLLQGGNLKRTAK